MSAGKFTLEDVREVGYKKKDAWWTVFLVDPIASRMIVPIANYTNLTPNQISLFAFILGIGSAVSFYMGSYEFLVLGALLYHFSFILDCIDGKIARLKGTGTIFGMWLDYMLDRARVAICAIALLYGQFVRSGELLYLYLALLVIFLDMTRYMNALHLYKMRREMRKKIKKSRKKLRNLLHQDHPEEEEPEHEDEEQPLASKKVDLQQGFKSRFSWYMRIRDFFINNRIRMHLFSGIEYQMFIFIIGPITGLIVETIILSSIVFVLFELAILYKVWLSTEDFNKEMAILEAEIEKVEAEQGVEVAEAR
ncbi:CDP-alcohol phosphatidyltransferase family protein [Desmospora profundinema]|uniref:Phosphatidylglycerophosphate synthase n=1 Tax=Desmospora profundinema TaxID=1571184 RepID=A0ABU1IM78_9BACL|nr:CDP-alcohol phosphatidyltransferase family protein [Desmospora profundinema]MDR6225882.1 phosphatidylglycerophosphate synthase [Desmospora profundinema]